MSASERPSAYQFGDWVVRPHCNEVKRDGVVRHLEPKVADVLDCLLASPGEIVSPEDIIDQVWSGRVVEPVSVARNIAQIRRALGDSTKNPRYIETISKRGYRTIAPVTPVTADEGTPRSATRRKVRSYPSWAVALFAVMLVILSAAAYFGQRGDALTAPNTDRSVIVLPFAAVGSDLSLHEHAIGLTHELAEALTGYQELRTVVGNDLTNASELASYAITGTVRRVDKDLRLRAHLARLSDAQSVWSASYDHALEGIAADESTLAVTIARTVRLRLVVDHECETVKRKSRSAEAAELICAALNDNYRVNQGGGFDPQLQFANAQRAIELDPDLTRGHAMISGFYQYAVAWGKLPSSEGSRLAHAVLEQARLIDPKDATTLYAISGNQLNLDLDDRSAEGNLRKAIELDPMHPNARWFHADLGSIELRRGNVAGSLEHLRRALRIHDADGRVYLQYAQALNSAGLHREAIEATQAGLRLIASGVYWLYLIMEQSHAQLELGQLEAARQSVDLALETTQPELRLFLAGTVAAVGRVDEAQRMLAELERQDFAHPTPVFFGYLYLDDRDEAFEWLAKAIDIRDGILLSTIRSHPYFNRLRGDPRWQDVMEHLANEEAQGRDVNRLRYGR